MHQHDLPEITSQVVALVKEASTFIGDQIGRVRTDQIEEKDRNSLVSYVDKEAERILVSGLKAIVPTATFLTEENTVENREGALQWIVDPLDGTTNFLQGIPFFSVSVALKSGNEPVIGVVMDVSRRECFYAWKGGGAFLDKKAISVSKTTTLDDCIVATGFHYSDFTRLRGHLKLLEFFVRKARGVRRMGSAALDLVYTACGRLDAFYEYSLNPWDVAAGVLIVHEAGGVLFDFSGGQDYLFGGEIVACNQNLRLMILEAIQIGYSEKPDFSF